MNKFKFFVTVNSITISADSKKELKDRIYRSFERHCDSSMAATQFNYLKDKYFNKVWGKNEAIDQYFEISSRSFSTYWQTYWTDILFILSFYIKYKSEARNLFNMEE